MTCDLQIAVREVRGVEGGLAARKPRDAVRLCARLSSRWLG